MQKRIMVVDDEETVVRALKMILEDEYEVKPFTTVACGYESLEWLKDNDIDYAILDVLINGVSGIDIAHTLIKKYSMNIPIMFITGCATDSLEYDKAIKMSQQYKNIKLCSKPFDEKGIKYSKRIKDDIKLSMK